MYNKDYSVLFYLMIVFLDLPSFLQSVLLEGGRCTDKSKKSFHDLMQGSVKSDLSKICQRSVLFWDVTVCDCGG